LEGGLPKRKEKFPLKKGGQGVVLATLCLSVFALKKIKFIHQNYLTPNQRCLIISGYTEYTTSSKLEILIQAQIRLKKLLTRICFSFKILPLSLRKIIVIDSH
jgi:hypothetical protein